MTTDNPQVPWTDEQWARVNQVVQEEASRARVAASFLPLFGPLSPDTDFVRSGRITYPELPEPDIRQQKNQIAIDDTTTIRLATLQVKVYVRGAQMADAEMTSVLALFRRAANLLARLEDAIIFDGLWGPPPPPLGGGCLPRLGTAGLRDTWEILGGEASDGLLAPIGSLAPAPVVIPAPPSGGPLVGSVTQAIGFLEGAGHFGPFAVVLDQEFFALAQTPDPGSLVLPQDRIIPFLGGGSLLRSSTLPPNSGVVVALGGAPFELVIATDVSLQFLQLTNEPRFLFRVFEKMVLRIKEPTAAIALLPQVPTVWAVSPTSGPVAGSTAANPFYVNILGANLIGAAQVNFGAAAVPIGVPNNTLITVPLPASPLAAPGTGAVAMTIQGPGLPALGFGSFTYV